MLLRSTIIALFVILYFGYSYEVQLIPSDVKSNFGDALEAIFGMGVRLQALAQESSDDNFLVSPISAAFLIAQLSLGAEGKFLEQLLALLQLPHHKNLNSSYAQLHEQMMLLLADIQEKSKQNQYYKLETANALFVDYKLNLKDKFVYELGKYKSEINRVNFLNSQRTTELMNKWAADHTKGLITQLLPSPAPPTTSSIFANAMYFKAEWEQPFSYEVNINSTFFMSHGRSVETTFMTGLLEQVPYVDYKKLNCRMLVLPYVNREMGFYIILPNTGHENEYNIKKFASQLKTDDYLHMFKELKNKDVLIKMPKLSFSKTFSFLKHLKKYREFKNLQRDTPMTRNPNPIPLLQEKINQFGMFRNYNDDDIYLTAAAQNANLTVSDIVQQMTLSVDEKGTEAAAITAGIMYYDGGSKTFAVNKPFLFFIRHEPTAATVFWGSISNPKA